MNNLLETLSGIIDEAQVGEDVKLVTRTILANFKTIDVLALKALADYGITIPDGHDAFLFINYTVTDCEILTTDLCNVHLPCHLLTTRNTLQERADKFVRSLFKLIVKHQLSKPKVICTTLESTSKSGTVAAKPTNHGVLTPHLQTSL